MIFLAPPQPPLAITLSDEGGMRHLHRRLLLLSLAFLTILVTSWFVLLGPISAIIALAFAKHILVALLVMGLGVDAQEEDASGYSDRLPDRDG